MAFQSYTITLDFPKPTPTLQIHDYTQESYENVRARERRHAKTYRKRRKGVAESTLWHNRCKCCGGLSVFRQSTQAGNIGVLDAHRIHDKGLVESDSAVVSGQPPLDSHTLPDLVTSRAATEQTSNSFSYDDPDNISTSTAATLVGTQLENYARADEKLHETTRPGNTASPVEALSSFTPGVASAGPDDQRAHHATATSVVSAIALVDGSVQPISSASMFQHSWTDQMDKDLLHFRDIARLSWPRVRKYYPAVALSELKARHKSLRLRRLNIGRTGPPQVAGSGPQGVTAQSKSCSGEPSDGLRIKHTSARDDNNGDISSSTKPQSIQSRSSSHKKRARREAQHCGAKRQPMSTSEHNERAHATQTEQCSPELPDSKFGRKRRRPHHDPRDGY